MKFDFTYYNPTKIYFGKSAFSNLEIELNTKLIDTENKISKLNEIIIDEQNNDKTFIYSTHYNEITPIKYTLSYIFNSYSKIGITKVIPCQ
jgi:3-dehydroquinate dehydratase